jgi:uncharacterized protein (TIGR03382 family)
VETILMRKFGAVRHVAAVGALLIGAPAFAGSLSGTVRNEASQPLQMMQVRLWAQGPKGYSIALSTVTDGAGNYAFANIPAGNYKLDARMAPMVSGNYGDRWYDVAAPTSGGYVAEDADVLAIAQTDALTGYDFTLQVLGGFDGRVYSGVNLFPGALIRAERAGEMRIHHNDLSQTPPHLGEFSLRGMVPANDYRFIVHDPNGAHETFVSQGPFGVGANMVTMLPPFMMVAAGGDPYEPNNSAGTAVDVDEAMFATFPPATYTSANARIAPRNTGDTDWYCWDAAAGDRFIIGAASMLTLNTGPRENPFVDPVLGFFSGDGSTKILEDDDSGPLSKDARIDTGILAAAGRYCAAVSTYGDTAFNGTTQQSAGRYELSIAMGNRKPTLAGTYNGNPVPQAPNTIEIAEGDSITLQFTYADPDQNALTVTNTFVDSASAPASGGSFVNGNGTATFSYTANAVAAGGSPYVLTVTVSDGEFTQTLTINIVVTAVNEAPSLPVQVAPADTSTVNTNQPNLVVQNSTDPDNDPLTYEYELYYGQATTPAQTVTAPQGSGGQTMKAPAAIPENTHVRWRVRAYDGNAMNGYSPWTTEWTFFVDQQNDPPAAPVFVKPEEQEVVMSRRPALQAQNPVDPEGDDVTLYFQLATDAQFTSGLIESPAVAASTLSSTTTWTVPNDLPWGSWWYGRVYAKDNRGGTSEPSNVNKFQVKPNVPPSVPTLGAPFDATCDGLVVNAAAATISAGPSSDPENESVSLQLQIFDFAADTSSATPLLDLTSPQTSGTATTFDVSSLSFAEDAHYRVRVRAYDGTDYSDWSQCDITLNADNSNPGGGDDGSASPGGCCDTGGSAGSSGLLALALAALLQRRRR